MIKDFSRIKEKVNAPMVTAFVFGIIIVIGMLGLLIWVLNKAYSRKDE